MKLALGAYCTTMVVGKKITVRLGDEIHRIACGHKVAGKSLRTFWMRNCDSCRITKKGYCDLCEHIATINFNRSFYLYIHDNGNGNGGKVNNKIDLDQEFDVTRGTTICFRKPQGQNDDPMIEFRVIEIDDNENEIDTKSVAFTTTVPVTIGDVDVDGTNEEVRVVNDTIVRSLESPTASRSAQRDPPESSKKANRKPPCPPGKSPIPSPHNNVNRMKRPSLRVLRNIKNRKQKLE